MDESLLRQSLESLRGDPDRLIEIILAQARVIEDLRARVEALERRGDDEEAPPRSAAPFRLPEKKRKKSPRPPGRKKGHRGAKREVPEVIDEEAHVPLPCCPDCGGAVTQVRPIEQVIEEIPPVRPRVTRVVTHQGRCARCGVVRSRHPLQTSTATGAAAVQLGPRAVGVALELNQRMGVTKRKTCEILRSLFGLRLTPGGLVHAAHRMARRLGPRYEAMRLAARRSSFLHADETSWWVGEPGWSLWVFTRPDLTLYRVEPTRARQVIFDTLGTEYGGVLVSDCLSVYDNASPVQHKCYAHHLKAISQAMENHPAEGAGLLASIRALLRRAMTIKRLWPDLTGVERHHARGYLAQQSDHLLRAPPAHPTELAVQRRLLKQEDHLFTFLDHPGVEATNNLAERQLRPAVIARKVSCGNRTSKGARTWQTLASIAATATQNGQSFLEIIANAARRLSDGR